MNKQHEVNINFESDAGNESGSDKEDGERDNGEWKGNSLSEKEGHAKEKLKEISSDTLTSSVKRHKKMTRYRYGDPPNFVDYQNYRFPFLTYDIASSMYLLRSFLHITLRLGTLFVVLLATGSVILFHWLEWRSDLPLTVVASGFIIPISFGISFTFQRRLVALQDLASLKASALSIYISSREWSPKNMRPSLANRVKGHLHVLLHKIAKYLAHKKDNVDEIYQDFDKLFKMIEELRTSEKWIISVISRSYQYARFMMNDFERLRVVHDFQSPSAFRGFTFFYLYFFSLFFAPLFANIAYQYGLAAGIYSSIFTSVMLLSLNHIIHDNEDPFDGFGIGKHHLTTLTLASQPPKKPISNPPSPSTASLP